MLWELVTRGGIGKSLLVIGSWAAAGSLQCLSPHSRKHPTSFFNEAKVYTFFVLGSFATYLWDSDPKIMNFVE